MCLQPVILALGNFWLETNLSLYIDYFNYAIILTCIEFILIIITINYYVDKYSRDNKYLKTTPIKYFNRHILYRNVVYILTIFITIIIIFSHIHYFYPFWDELNLELVVERTESLQQNSWYYIVDLLANWIRPLLPFWILFRLYSKYGKNSYWGIIAIALANFAFTSERRIYSIIIGGICLYYLLALVKDKKHQLHTKILITLGVFGICYVLFYNYSVQGGNTMIARTINRYFSGPSLTAMNLQINENTDVQPLVFIKLLLNDFQIFTSLFTRFEIPNYYQQYYGMSKGLWIPFVVGSIRYFGLLFPFVIIFLTKFVIYMDYKSRINRSTLYKMIYSYMGIVVSCYMIMYSIELIIYFLLSTVILFNLLIKFDKRY